MTEATSPKIEQQDGLTIIHLGEEYENLDETALDSLREILLKAVDEADPPKVILDLSHTTFFGSSFIELIFRAWNRVQNQPGGVFVISGLTKYCREVVAITHLDRLWKLYDNVDAAVADLKD